MSLVIVTIVCLVFLFIALKNRGGVSVPWKRKPEVIGAAGEKAIANRLDGLPEGYDLFNDVMFEHGGTTTQIDHIVVSVYGNVRPLLAERPDWRCEGNAAVLLLPSLSQVDATV